MNEERVRLAGEFVLQTLSADERAAALALLASDPAFVGEVRAWERRLTPLALNLPEVQPAAGTWEAIERRIAGAPVANDVAPTAGSGWRFGTIAASLVAAVLAGLLAWRSEPQPEPAVVQPPVVVAAAEPRAQTVAVLNEAGAKPGLLLTVDEATGAVVAQPVNLSAPAGRSLQLWSIVGAGAPRSLGLLDPAQTARFRVGLDAAQPGTTFAVSVEPLGGSPGDAPTGPITFTGQAIRVTQPS